MEGCWGKSYTHSLKSNTYKSCIWKTEITCYQRCLMILEPFGKKSPHEALNFFHESGCIFKSKVFYGLLWKLFLSLKMLCCESSSWGALKKWCIPLYLLQGKSFTTINILKLLENQQSHQFLLAYCLLTLILVKPMLSAGIIRHFEWKTGRSWMKSDLSKSLWQYRFFEGEK